MITYKNISTSKNKEIKADRDVKNLIELLFIKQVDKRLGSGDRGLSEITSHKWFLNFDWDLFSKRKMQNPIFIQEPVNIEEYYTNNITNSPEMSLVLSLRDKPFKEADENFILQDNISEINMKSDSKININNTVGKENLEERQLLYKLFEFIDEIDD